MIQRTVVRRVGAQRRGSKRPKWKGKKGKGKLEVIGRVVPVRRLVSARPELKSSRLRLNNGRKRLPSQGDVRRTTHLGIPGEPPDDRASELPRPTVSLDDERRGESAVPVPLGRLLVSSRSPVEFRPTEALPSINRHHIDDRNVEPKTPATRLEGNVKTILTLGVRSGRLLDQNLAANAILDPGGQPPDDPVVPADDVPPLLALVDVDAPLVEGVPANSAVGGDQGTMGVDVLVSLGRDPSPKPPDDCNTKEGVLNPVILLLPLSLSPSLPSLPLSLSPSLPLSLSSSSSLAHTKYVEINHHRVRRYCKACLQDGLREKMAKDSLLR